MPWRKRLNEHFPGGGGTLTRGLSVRSTGDRDVAEDPPASYPDTAPAIGTTVTLDESYAEGTLSITRASDGHDYVEGVDFEEVAPNQWTNLAIPDGTGIVIDYILDTSQDGNLGVRLQLEGVNLPLSGLWNLEEGFEAELNAITGAIDIIAAGGGGSGGGGPVPPVQSLTLLNGWSYVAGGQVPGCYLDRERVWLRGRIGGGTQSVGTVLFTLPTGHRPAFLTTLLAASDNAPIPLDAQTDGDVVIADSAFQVGVEWLSLDGLSFRLVDTTTAEFQNWGQTDVLFGTSDMDVPYSELP